MVEPEIACVDGSGGVTVTQDQRLVWRVSGSRCYP